VCAVTGDLQVSAFTYKFQITIPTSISIGPFPPSRAR